MEEITGERSDAVVYVKDDYTYKLNKTVQNKKYFQCRENNCRARAILTGDVEFQLTSPHNHESTQLKVERLRFRMNLRRRAATERSRRVDIYRNEQLGQTHEMLLTVGGYRSHKDLMYRAYSRENPPLPASLQRYGELLVDQRWVQRYAMEKRNAAEPANRFFRTVLTAADNVKIALFMSSAVEEYVRRGEPLILHMDATFKVVPRGITGAQFFTVQVYYKGSVYPLIYAIMEKKTEQSYVTIMEYVHLQIPEANVASVMSDCETALRNAIRQVYPDINITGCWFNYAKTVYLKAREMKLVNIRNVNINCRRIVKMAMVLPLLPQHAVRQGLNCLRQEAVNLPEMTLFLNYLNHQWMNKQIFVYCLEQRTNNAVESFHHHFMETVGRPHPNIWHFTEELQNFEHTKAYDLFRAIDRKQHRSVSYLDKRIKDAQNLFDQNGDVRAFLGRCYHFMDGLERNILQRPEPNDVPLLRPANLPNNPPRPANPFPLPQTINPIPPPHRPAIPPRPAVPLHLPQPVNPNPPPRPANPLHRLQPVNPIPPPRPANPPLLVPLLRSNSHLNPLPHVNPVNSPPLTPSQPVYPNLVFVDNNNPPPLIPLQPVLHNNDDPPLIFLNAYL